MGRENRFFSGFIIIIFNRFDEFSVSPLPASPSSFVKIIFNFFFSSDKAEKSEFSAVFAGFSCFGRAELASPPPREKGREKLLGGKTGEIFPKNPLFQHKPRLSG